ncbi:hypothetical protein [Aquamicrobium sp. LC103]|uniref:hypothetical protein n=1 Tax=Aquamicrobium sp. LC103 TaxID=1120658 RepID=UPI000A808FB8|nr:hypothetical protein [Aquamicrobium sp. LC103]
MLFRLAIIYLVAAAFAAGLAQLVSHTSETGPPERASLPCEQWSNPDCKPPVLR